MRLIDADALVAKQANIAKTFARSDAQKSLMGRVMYNTESAPTIDAIPVEWLNKQCEMADDRGDMEMTDAISWLIQTWHEEQEAQDGKV